MPTIGFVPDSFNVMEGDQVTFTVEVTSGTLERDVEVEFSTQSGTATEDGESPLTQSHLMKHLHTLTHAYNSS